MAITEKTLAQSTISSGTQTIFTATATDIVKIIWLCNNTASDVTVSLYIVPSGSTAGIANIILNAVTVPANDFTQISTYMPMETTGDTVQALCSTQTAATISLFGASVT